MNPKCSPPTWIFFDLDNTLLSWDQMYQAFFRKISFDKSETQSFEMARRLVKSELSDQSPTARNRLLYLKSFLQLEARFTAAECLRLADLYEKTIFSESRKQALRLGRHKLFRKLKRNYRMGIVTNENLRTQLWKLKALDPRGNYFDFIITSEEAGVEKPRQGIFKRALAMAQCSPSQVVFVGDNIAFDILPAQSLGMLPIYSSEFAKRTQVPRYVSQIDRLSELPTLLARLGL